jgi:hypothetical protein
MTIHWKALAEHFLLVPLVFLIQLFRRKIIFPKKFKFLETYRHDHSLESSCGALSVGAISFFDSTVSEKNHFLNFSQKTSVLKELN